MIPRKRLLRGFVTSEGGEEAGKGELAFDVFPTLRFPLTLSTLTPPLWLASPSSFHPPASLFPCLDIPRLPPPTDRLLIPRIHPPAAQLAASFPFIPLLPSLKHPPHPLSIELKEDALLATHRPPCFPAAVFSSRGSLRRKSL